MFPSLWGIREWKHRPGLCKFLLLHSIFFYQGVSSSQTLSINFSVVIPSLASCYTWPWSDSYFATSARRWATNGQWPCLVSVSPYHPAQHMVRAVLRKCSPSFIYSGQSRQSKYYEIKYGTLTVMELNYSHIILYLSLNSKAPPTYSKELVNNYFPSDISILLFQILFVHWIFASLFLTHSLLYTFHDIILLTFKILILGIICFTVA